jgi:hypothetical protein
VGRVPPEPIHPTMPSLPDTATLCLYRSLASSAFAAVFLVLSAGRRDETHRPSGAAPTRFRATDRVTAAGGSS